MSAHNEILELKKRISQSIIGQTLVVERLLLTLLCNGNVLVEGLPGLAKTRAVKSLAKNLEADFSSILNRVQKGFAKKSGKFSFMPEPNLFRIFPQIKLILRC